MDNITKESLQEERANLLAAVQSDDEAYIGLLDTISNFHKYPLPEQLNFFYHAPKDTRALAPRAIWERIYGTSIVNNADAVPVLEENGRISYVYDVRDTIGFLQGDERLYSLPWAYDAERDANALRLAAGAAADASIDDALRAYIQNRAIGSDYPSQVAAATEYIVRKRLGLEADDTPLRSMERENISGEQLLGEISSLSRDILNNIQMNIINERKREEQNAERLRNVGGPSEGLSEAGEAGDMEAASRGSGHREVPSGISGGDGRESGAPDEGTREEDESDRGTEEDERNGLDTQEEPDPADGSRSDAAGNPDLKGLPSLGGLSAEEAETAFRAYVDGIGGAFGQGAIDAEAARAFYRDGVMLIVSGEGSFVAEKRDELTAFVVDALQYTYGRTVSEPEQEAEAEPETESETEEAAAEPEPEAAPDEPVFDMDSSIYEWYKSVHPTDPDAESIRQDISFADVLEHLENSQDGQDFYDFTGITVSDIRESIFNKLSELSGRPYDDIYNLFIGASNVQTVEEDEEAAPEKETYKYYLIHRPVSIGTQPDDFIRFADDDEIQREQETLSDNLSIMGIVYYDHPLTEKQIQDYELLDARQVARRRELVRSYYEEIGQEAAPWMTCTFQELYDALESGTDYPTFFGLTSDSEVAAPFYGQLIATDYLTYGKEMGRRMNVDSHYILQLMAQNYTKETADALRFIRRSAKEEARKKAEEKEAEAENASAPPDYAAMAASPVFASMMQDLKNVLSSEATMITIIQQFDWMMNDHLYLALGLIHHENPELRERVSEYLEELNYHTAGEQLEAGQYDAYFSDNDVLNQYLGRHPLDGAAVRDEAIARASQNVLNLAAKMKAWRTNPPFDTTPYIEAKEYIRARLAREEWVNSGTIPNLNQGTAVALMLNYIEHPELRSKVLICMQADAKLYYDLSNGRYEDFFAACHIDLNQTAEETREEQPETVEEAGEEHEEPAPQRTIEPREAAAPEENRIDLDTLDLTADLDSVSGQRAVFRRNIAAIQIVHDLEKTNRQPTEQELAVLRSYAGFGALSNAFDPNNSSWRTEYKLARETMSETEYASAKESTLSAFYTPKEVIDGIYEGLESGGLTGGINILDPSTGSGRFLSGMPDNLKENSHLFGVELDELSAKIAKYANPDADITKAPFEDTTFADNAFDFAISNVPFGNFPINDAERYSGHNYMIHDYFINRMIDEVRPGGIVVAITSKGTMDKANDAARKDFARKAELIKGIRLDNEVFRGAGTNAVSDILIFRKREKELGPDDALPEWVNTSMQAESQGYYGPDVPYRINDYFHNHSRNIKGRLEVESSAIGDVVTVKPSYDDKPLKDIIADSIREAGSFFAKAAEPLPVPEQKPVVQHDHEFGYIIRNGDLMYMAPNGSIQMTELSASAASKVRSAVKIRDHIRSMLTEELNGCTEERLGVLQATLNQLYDDHVRNYGRIYKDRELGKLFSNDSGYAILLSLEEIEENKFVGKSDIFSKRTISAQIVPDHADTATDALMISMQEKGSVNIPYMARLTGRSNEEIVSELEFNEIFEDIEHHKFVTADEYLSGDIRGRIEYLENQLDNWTDELHELAARELANLPSGEYRSFTAKNFPFPEAYTDGEFDSRKLTEEQAARLFIDPQNKDAMLFAINTSPLSRQDVLLEKALDASPGLHDRFDDPAYAFEIWRSGVMNDNIINFFQTRGKGCYMLEHAAENIHRMNPDLAPTDPVIHGFLKKISEDYDRGAHPEVFSWAYIENNFEPFAEEFRAALEKKSETMTGEIAESLRDDIARARKNMTALEKVKPKDLEAEEIDIFLGAPWVETDDVEEFARETFDYPSVNISYSDISGAWKVSTMYGSGINKADNVYGVEDRNAFQLLEAALNHSQVNITKTVMVDGEEKRVIDREKTLLAARKIQDIRDAFHNWIFKDEERKEKYVAYYNRHFNNIVPRHFDGSRLTFPGMNPEIELRPHQKDAVARTLFGGNTLLAHVVGAGKTFEMQASAMEAKRIGLCHKSMMIMPKHLIQQFGAEFQRLYPDAKILVAEPKDFTTAGRQEFCAKITAKDWDAIVLSYEQFGKIPLSIERRRKFLQDEADEILDAIQEAKRESGSKSFTVKQAQREYKKIIGSLEKLEDEYHKHQDSTLTFEQLGIDRLYVDESHFYKNLGFYTRIPGIQSAHVQKTDDMIAKCDYINELTNERGIVFASGTPISNSMAELYTLSRYLKPSRLKSQGLEAFDSWAATFGDQVTQMELEPAGDKFRQKTRFSHFANVPELVSMFKEFADVKLADQLNLPVPDSDVKVVVAEASPTQKAMIQDLIERSDLIKKGSPMVINEETHSENDAKGLDNMLNITREGRELALDPRLIDKDLPDYPKSKLNLCVNNVAKIYKDTADKKSTQLVFCDIGTPGADKGNRFTVYDDIKEKLIAQGIKEKEIAFIHSYETPKKKEELFKKVRKGEVRVLLGSSDKLGVGTNVQDKIIAMHELDCPWKPAQIEQRRGRGVRVGNENDHIDIYRYVTKGTFDAYMWQTNEFKQKFISQVMTSSLPSRTCDDVDDFQLEASQIKTACTENPLYQEQMSLENEVRMLKMERAQFFDARKKMEHTIQTIPNDIRNIDKKIAVVEEDMASYAKGQHEGFIVDGKEYKDKEIGKYLSKVVEKFYNDEMEKSPRGTYHGLKFTVTYNPKESPFPKLCYYNKGSYFPCSLVKTASDNLARFDSIGVFLEGKHKDLEMRKKDLEDTLNNIKKDYEQPFIKEDELKAKEARLSEVNALVLADDKKDAEREQESRIEAIRSGGAEELDSACAKTYTKLANTQLTLHDDEWDASYDKDIVHALRQHGFSKDEITDAIYSYSPSVPTKEQAEALTADKKKEIAACR